MPKTIGDDLMELAISGTYHCAKLCGVDLLNPSLWAGFFVGTFSCPISWAFFYNKTTRMASQRTIYLGTIICIALVSALHAHSAATTTYLFYFNAGLLFAPMALSASCEVFMFLLTVGLHDHYSFRAGFKRWFKLVCECIFAIAPAIFIQHAVFRLK